MGTIEVIFFVFFGAMGFVVLVWFLLVTKLFNLIEQNHPDKFQDMGEPHLSKNNTLSTNVAFMRYLFKKEWTSLNDPELTSLSITMRRIFITTLIVFLPAMVILPILLMPPL
ncbi:MAG: hypothetical protein P8M49_12910 [Thalassotalea sp.]|nr:hypothetical protein [Thalassotalea sp.]MDG2394411.1 hypothetical protein [Thalassotalea sp.]